MRWSNNVSAQVNYLHNIVQTTCESCLALVSVLYYLRKKILDGMTMRSDGRVCVYISSCGRGR